MAEVVGTCTAPSAARSAERKPETMVLKMLPIVSEPGDGMHRMWAWRARRSGSTWRTATLPEALPQRSHCVSTTALKVSFVGS